MSCIFCGAEAGCEHAGGEVGEVITPVEVEVPGAFDPYPNAIPSRWWPSESLPPAAPSP